MNKDVTFLLEEISRLEKIMQDSLEIAYALGWEHGHASYDQNHIYDTSTLCDIPPGREGVSPR